MKLSEMRALLTTRGIQLTRSLGQNFLHDGNQLRRIVALAELQPGDSVLEVGPGLGPLTEHLLAAGADVLAIEKDARLVTVLAERFGVRARRPEGHSPTGTDLAGGAVTVGSAAPGTASPAPEVPEPRGPLPLLPHGERLHLVQADALGVVADATRDWTGWKLVANLPYSVASPILVELATAAGAPERLVATLQLEVVRRLMAGPGSKDYGVLSLLVQLRYEPRGSFKIPADCFFPAPDVDSGCVVLVRRPGEALDAAGRRAFVRLVKRAFSERRKKALKLLKFDWPAAVLETAWSDLGLDPQVRAENLGREHFLELARRMPAAAPEPPAAPPPS